MSDYFDPEDNCTLSAEDLRASEPGVQKRVMEGWFRSRFEDPAERTPYETAEGGYQWIWGGPFDAQEELENEFSSVVPNEVIEELVDDLQGECLQWAPTPQQEDYDEYLVGDIARISTYYQTFQSAILDVEALLKIIVPEPVAPCFVRLLYVNVITALETYLSDAFINTVLNRPKLLRKFIEMSPEFQSERIPFADVFKAVEESQKRARAYLADVVWHHLARVRPMYKSTLDITFPDDIGPLFRAIVTRHDIVHRNGRTKSGEEILLTVADVQSLIAAVEAFTQHIYEELAERRAEPAEGLPTVEGSAF